MFHSVGKSFSIGVGQAGGVQGVWVLVAGEFHGNVVLAGDGVQGYVVHGTGGLYGGWVQAAGRV